MSATRGPALSEHGAKRRRVEGFTLAEVLVSIVIVGTALTVIAQGIALGLRGDAMAERHTMASQVLDEVVARLETGEISLTEDSEGELPDLAEGYRYEVDVEAFTDPPDLVKARITVAWGADERGRDPAGSLAAERWLYRGQAASEGGVTRGPTIGSQGGAR